MVERPEPAEPAWVLLFAGALVASTALSRAAPEADARAVEARIPGLPLGTPERSLDLERLSAREMRRLPGIGPQRALAIARARWEQSLRGAPEAWDVIPGIGEETVRSIRESIEAAGPPRTRSWP